MNHPSPRLKEIVQDIVTAYGSTSDPSWSFVTQRWEQNFHRDVIAQLAANFRIEETTDVNIDTSRSFSLGDEPIGVRLSLVGGYACLSDPHGNVLTNAQLAGGNSITSIGAILAAQDVAILSHEFLSQTIPFDGERTDLYHILFSEDRDD